MIPIIRRCPLCHGTKTWLAEWPSVGYSRLIPCPVCSGKGSVRISWQGIPRTIHSRRPCRDEFGYRAEYRCGYCAHIFNQPREWDYSHSEDGWCPNCNTTNYDLNSIYSHVFKAKTRRAIHLKPIQELAA